jgi:hypothetical protein
VIEVAETTVKVVAAVVLKVTPVAPVNPVPVIVTTVPTGPWVGVNPVIVAHDEDTVKLVSVEPVPLGVVTLIGPVVAPVGTNTSILVAEATLKAGALVPLNSTPVAPVKFVPVRATAEPTAPHVGVNEGIVGQLLLPTVKLVALSAVPDAFVT